MQEMSTYVESIKSDMDTIALQAKLYQANALLVRANQIIASLPNNRKWREDYKTFKAKQNDNSRV